jgi:hypothetical protein
VKRVPEYPDQAWAEVRGCPVELLREDGVLFVAVLEERRMPRDYSHELTSDELRELADAMDRVPRHA